MKPQPKEKRLNNDSFSYKSSLPSLFFPLLFLPLKSFLGFIVQLCCPGSRSALSLKASVCVKVWFTAFESQLFMRSCTKGLPVTCYEHRQDIIQVVNERQKSLGECCCLFNCFGSTTKLLYEIYLNLPTTALITLGKSVLIVSCFLPTHCSPPFPE